MAKDTEITRKAFSADVTVNEGERSVTARITTAAVDRDNEVLIPAGCNAKDFQANPVVFLNHSYWTLPVGKCTGIQRDETGITAKTTFAERPKNHPEGQEWVPDTLFSLFQQGVLKGFSVGFIPIEARPATDKDVLDFGAGVRRVFSKWKLLEYSVAPLPCNQEAVAMAVSKGFIGADLAEKLFGKPVETTKSEEKPAENPAEETKTPAGMPPAMGKCSTCGKEYDVTEMQMMDAEDGADPGYMCKDCAAKKTETPTPAAEPEKSARHVVHTIETEEPKEVVAIKRVHKVLESKVAKKSPVKKLVIAEVRKLQGHLY